MALWIEETRLCDADDESSSDMSSEELDIDYDDEFNLEIEGETVSEESSNEMSKSGSKSETYVVACWWVEDMTVGNHAHGEMLLNEAIGPSKRQESTWGDITYREKVSHKI
jgi:hypothetical protein